MKASFSCAFQICRTWVVKKVITSIYSFNSPLRAQQPQTAQGTKRTTGRTEDEGRACRPVRAGPGSSCHSPLFLLPALSQPRPSPGPQSSPDNCWAPTEAALLSVGGKNSHEDTRQMFLNTFQNWNRLNLSFIFTKGFCFLLWWKSKSKYHSIMISEEVNVKVRTRASLSASREPPVCSCRSA